MVQSQTVGKFGCSSKSKTENHHMMVLLSNSAHGTGNRCSNKHVHRCPREERPLMGEWMDQRWHLHAMELGEPLKGEKHCLMPQRQSQMQWGMTLLLLTIQVITKRATP